MKQNEQLKNKVRATRTEPKNKKNLSVFLNLDSEGCVNSSTFHVHFICRYYDYSFLYLFIVIVNNTNNNV